MKGFHGQVFSIFREEVEEWKSLKDEDLNIQKSKCGRERSTCQGAAIRRTRDAERRDLGGRGGGRGCAAGEQSVLDMAADGVDAFCTNTIA